MFYLCMHACMPISHPACYRWRGWHCLTLFQPLILPEWSKYFSNQDMSKKSFVKWWYMSPLNLLCAGWEAEKNQHTPPKRCSSTRQVLPTSWDPQYHQWGLSRPVGQPTDRGAGGKCNVSQSRIQGTEGCTGSRPRTAAGGKAWWSCFQEEPETGGLWEARGMWPQ